MKLGDYPQWDNPVRETILVKRNRKIRRERMERYRSVPIVSRVWWVELTKLEADRSWFGQRDLPTGLTFEPQKFWCCTKRKARQLVEWDRARGGSGSMYPVEFRRCPVCDRAMLGAQATEYREKLAKPKRTWHYPQGPACNMECKPRGQKA